jgi:general secretion pathway protein C
LNRLPFLSTVAAVLALSASLAYWGLQLFTPQQRQIAAVPLQQAPEAPIELARGLFGGQTAVAAVSNYQLVGVVASRAGQRSVAIIVANGAPAKAYPVGEEIAQGVTVHDVQARHVILLEGGVQKRIDLPAAEGVSSTTSAPLAPVNPPTMTPPPAPSGTPLVTPPPGTPVGPPGQLAPITAPAQQPTTSR